MDTASAVESKPTLSPYVVHELESFLKTKFASEEFLYEIEQATEKGENYIGVVYRVKAGPKTGDEASGRHCYSIIVKVPPSSPIQRKQFFARPCFLRESFAYEEFLPLAERFQTEKGLVGDHGKFKGYGEVYRCFKVEYNEAIFMEDLSRRNYRLFDRFKELDYEHVAFVMRTYAQLHAVSLALKAQQPSKLQAFEQMEDIFEQRKDDEQLGAYFEHLKESALKSLDIKEDEKYYNILEKYFAKSTFFDLLLQAINGKNSLSVVCHGDCWNNNILFKYNEEGAVVDAKLIDWQVMRYASPVTDIMYYLFTCTTGRFRRKHFQSMMGIYYDELSRHMERLKSKSAEVFPREAFEKELLETGVSGLLFAMIVLPIVTLKSEDTPNLEELSERIEAGHTTDLKGAGFLGDNNTGSYRKRMRDVIIDCIDLGYIKMN